MPCWYGRLPVAMDVHNIGDSGGCSVAIGPLQPFSTSPWTLGILPACISGRITFQSAASQPTSRIFRKPAPYCDATNFWMRNTKCCCGRPPASAACAKVVCLAASKAAALLGSDGCKECASTNSPAAVTNPKIHTGCVTADADLPTTLVIFFAPFIAIDGPFANISGVG